MKACKCWNCSRRVFRVRIKGDEGSGETQNFVNGSWREEGARRGGNRDPGEPIREVGKRWEREEVRFIEANRAKVFTGVVRGMHSFRNMERRRKVEM